VCVLALVLTSTMTLVSSLDDAAAALVAGDHEACGKAAQETLATGTLDVADVARAWTLRGQCFVLAGDADRAERSYGVALRILPALATDESLQAPGLSGDATFLLAKRSLPPVPGLAAQASFVDDDTLEVELLGDDLLLVKGASIVHGADEVARMPLEVGQAKHKVSGLERTDLVAVLLDKYGNALLRLPIDPTVKKVFTPAPSSSSPAAPGLGAAPTLLTTLGATAIGAGIVGVVTSGIALASLGDTALDEGGVWVVGVGASTGLFLVGAGLVVVDQGL
jgi:hypothetical protein